MENQGENEANISVDLTFDQVIEELTKFETFFTDKDSVKLLADWLHEDYGINKAASRLALKYIIPFVLNRLSQLGKVVAQSWINKLHDNLSHRPLYEKLSRTLLDTLKTRTDKTYQSAMQVADPKQLKQLQATPSWTQLNAEQQGLVHLLLAQEKNHQQQLGISNNLHHLIDLLSFDLDLKSVDQLKSQAENVEKGSAIWLTYFKQHSDLIGRDAQLNRLDEFYDQETMFSWWAISGAGGIGKSRLALESIARHDYLWDAGFLHASKLDVPDALHKWMPLQPTIIVIDYAASYSKQIANWLDHIIQHKDDYLCPVRILILEREFKNQAWWEHLTTGSSAALVRKNAFYTQSDPLELMSLNKTDQQTALASFLSSLDACDKLPEKDSVIWETIHELTTKGSPLFLGMVAIALAYNSFSDIRQWQHLDLLDNIYSREKQAWQRHLADLSKQQQEQTINLLAFSTFIGGFDWDNHKEESIQTLLACELIDSKRDITKVRQRMTLLTGHEAGYLQPDLIGEYFLLHHDLFEDDDVLKRAFLLAPNGTLQSLSRCAADYSENKKSFNWWQALLYLSQDSDIKLYEVAFDIVRQLTLKMIDDIAINIWMPVFGNKIQTLGSAFNSIGIIHNSNFDYKNACKYFKRALRFSRDIGDLALERTVINNIAQIFISQENYEVASKLLKRSLVLCEKTKNKEGEGMTLASMMVIAHKNFEYDKALSYFQDSLLIFRGMEDKNVEATILYNISHTYTAMREYSLALDCLKKSLHIKRKIGSKISEGSVLHDIALIYRCLRDDEQALKYFQQSLTIFREIDDKAGLCDTLINLGRLYHQSGQGSKAFSVWIDAFQIASSIGLKSALDALKSLGLPDSLVGWQALLDERNS
jgi:tetratricopeptide (TPR) repeat protein